MNLKPLFLVTTLLAALPLTVQAEGFDVIGGPDGSTQTLYHCGLLPTTGKRYTTSPTTIRIIESKLQQLGYATHAGSGVYGRKDKAAVRRFQADNGLQVDGIVGPLTAQKLAYASHPATNVHRCTKPAVALR